MKILHLGKYYPLKGGMEKAVLDIVEEFSGRGIQCDLLCVSTAEPGVVRLNDCARIYATAAVCHANSVSIAPSMIPMLRRICDQYDIIPRALPQPDGYACALPFRAIRGRSWSIGTATSCASASR